MRSSEWIIVYSLEIKCQNFLHMVENTDNPLIIESVKNQHDRAGKSLLDEARELVQQERATPHVLPVRQ